MVHLCHPDSVVLNNRIRRTKEDNPAIRRAVDHVVTYDSGTAADTDTIGPFHKCVRTTRTDVIVLNYDVVATEVTFRDVQTGPTTRIVRAYIFDQLVRIRAAHFNVCSTKIWSGTATGPVDLKRDE